MKDETVEQPESEKDANPGSSASAEGKTYTQADLDAMFGERAKQASAALLKKLGFEDFDSAAATVKKAREADEANKSELQKAQERAVELEKQLADAAQARKELATQAEIVNVANKMGLVDPDAAYKLLDKGALEFDGDGKPKNVDVLLQGLLKDKPYLVGVNQPGPFNHGKSGSEDAIVLAAKKAAGLSE